MDAINDDEEVGKDVQAVMDWWERKPGEGGYVEEMKPDEVEQTSVMCNEVTK